jgi:hypothetical protein
LQGRSSAGGAAELGVMEFPFCSIVVIELATYLSSFVLYIVRPSARPK